MCVFSKPDTPEPPPPAKQYAAPKKPVEISGNSGRFQTRQRAGSGSVRDRAPTAVLGAVNTPNGVPPRTVLGA